MTLARWQEVKSIVALAMEAPRLERDALVISACGDDPDLRHEVESLLAAGDIDDSLPHLRAAIASTAEEIVDKDEALRRTLETALAGQYEIIRSLGHGGMGSVYLARERALERFVAIKVLRPELAVAEVHRERFRREARIVARLSHPGILGLHSFGEIGNLWYFVMTYVSGETLAERIRREGMLPWTEAHRILTEMAEALECAHRNGVIHRDIKPANILLEGESGRAILADFGISKMPGATESLTASGAILGTPDYMSPEQVTGASDIDERSDIYSLGAVAYVMLTGREPFRAATAAATIYKRLVEDAASIETIVSSVPADLSSIVRRCMARETRERFPSAKSLREALDSIPAAGRLPDAVRDLRGFGPYAILWAAAWLTFGLLTTRSSGERVLLVLVALIAPLGVVIHLRNGSGSGIRFVDLARIASWPPDWWTMWWPRTLRRPADMWSRLPFAARALRVTISASFPALVLIILMRGQLALASDGIYRQWIGIAEWSILGVCIVAVASAFAWARWSGVALDESVRLLLGPTLPSVAWRHPSLSRLLAPAVRTVREPIGDTPSDFLRAIREVVPLLASGARHEGARVTSTAERLLKAIHQRDGELATLARDAGPQEEKRLAGQLDAIGSSRVGHSGEQAELRDLIRGQLEVVRRMQVRHDLVSGQRSHLVEQLRNLWILARAAGESRPGDLHALDRLATLCAEIEAEQA